MMTSAAAADAHVNRGRNYYRAETCCHVFERDRPAWQRRYRWRSQLGTHLRKPRLKCEGGFAASLARKTEHPMEQRNLGGSGLKVPPLCFGGNVFGRSEEHTSE